MSTSDGGRSGSGIRHQPRPARPYTMVGGRTRPTRKALALESLVVRTERGVSAMPHVRFERLDILALTAAPISVLELASYLRVPYGVVRVLVDDLAAEGLIALTEPDSGGPTIDLLERVLQGLHTL